MKTKVITLALLFAFSFLCNAQKQLKKVDSIVKSKLAKDDPALFVGIVKDGKIIYEKYRGLSNLQDKIKANKYTRSNIASTAKQFTALMILDLSLQGKLNLEDDIRKYLPKLYPNVKEEIKIKHLLNHTSGIRDFYDLMGLQQKPWWRREGLSNDDAVSLLEKQEDLGFKPGSAYTYSNSGYTLLTKIIEAVTKEKFHPYSKDFFENLGMYNTTFLENYMHVIPNQAIPYSDWGDGVWQQYPMIANLYGDGFLFTTLKDQLIFEQAVQNANYNNNILLIESQKPIKNSKIKKYGYGLELNDRLNHKAVHHAGGTGSYNSQMVRYPEQKLTIFIMSNNSKIWSGGLADEIARLYLPKVDKKINYDDKLNNITNTVSKSDFLGQYHSPSDRLIRVSEENGEIIWRNANRNPITLIKESKNKYSAKYDNRIKVGFFKDAMMLFYPSGKAIEYTKLKEEKITLSDLESYEGEYHSRELDVNFSLTLVKDKLMIALDGWDEKEKVEILNRNELLVYDYILKIERDHFNRVVGIKLTTNRVLNNRFYKKTNLKYQPKIETENGSINVSTIGSRDGDSSQILLTKNYENGNEIWYKQFGGTSYDKASSIVATDDGYLIVGSTSSFGKGNYDMYVIKTDKEGNKEWQNTYGDVENEYGYMAELTPKGYIIKGSTQKCLSNQNNINQKCTTNIWYVSIDKNGKELSNKVLEEIN